MKISVDFSGFDRLAMQMGANESSWEPRAVVWDEENVPLDKISVVNGLLTYKDRQILIYIKDGRNSRDTLLYQPEETQRFHIAECSTLSQMRRDGRFERYVVTNRTNGEFLVDATDEGTREVEVIVARLYVCRHCLRELDWNGYGRARNPRRDEIRDGFKIDEFFSKSKLISKSDPRLKFVSEPEHSDRTAPMGGYGKDWKRISEFTRTTRGSTCEQCKVKLVGRNFRLLDTHHRNGVTSDNRDENLVVLCKICHSTQARHGAMWVSWSDRKLIEAERKSQGITIR